MGSSYYVMEFHSKARTKTFKLENKMIGQLTTSLMIPSH